MEDSSLVSQKEYEVALFSLRGEQAARLTDYEGQVVRLERQVDRYQTLAGIEELTRRARDVCSASAADGPAPRTSCSSQTLAAPTRESGCQVGGMFYDLETSILGEICEYLSK